jgi:oxygen-independent coproporphyrinogen-3 oxidase
MSSNAKSSEEIKNHNFDRDVSIYIHIPFCERRCLYCDFVTEAGKKHLIPEYLTALSQEIRVMAEEFPPTSAIHTIYFGGGTPSLIPILGLKNLIEEIFDLFPVKKGAEITLEMNPGTVDQVYMDGLFSSGVNRLSIGLQSAIDAELKTLGRIHDYAQFLETYHSVNKTGFENISVDLIFGIPGQTISSWNESLKKVLELAPAHLSLYSLTIEDDTPFGQMVEQGILEEPDGDTLADMYELASDKLETSGFVQYEISNWAKEIPVGSLKLSRHNLQYWRNLPYLGLGTGAHGSSAGVRTANTPNIEEYIKRSSDQHKKEYPGSFATVEWQSIDKFEQMQETMMLGLRLTREGVSEREFISRYGVELQSIFGKQIEKLVSNGLLEILSDDRKTIRLTKKGRLLGNLVFMNFVGD